MILTKEVEVKVRPSIIEYYQSLGYEIPMKRASKSYYDKTKKEFVYDLSKTIMVKIEDLHIHSNVFIEVLCDMCQKNISLIKYNDYNKCIKNSGSHVCKECWSKKAMQTNEKRYGYKVVTQNEKIKEKIATTNLGRYGVKSYGQTKECHEKIKQTCLEKYGVEHHSRCTDIKEKKSNTFYENGTTPTSKQQRYIFNLYNQNKQFFLNYPISHYNIDICSPEEKLAIEYDGGFHNGQVKLGQLTQEEFNQKELIRDKIVKKEGYKQMRIISTKDILPSDEIILQMLSTAREYFNTTSHSWINFDIDNSIMINAENKNIGGIYFDYGKLRQIKEVSNNTYA